MQQLNTTPSTEEEEKKTCSIINISKEKNKGIYHETHYS